MPISFGPLREYLKTNKISYYYLSNQGIDNRTIDRFRHDKPVTTTTLGKVCAILDCQPGDLLRHDPDLENETDE